VATGPVGWGVFCLIAGLEAVVISIRWKRESTAPQKVVVVSMLAPPVDREAAFRSQLRGLIERGEKFSSSGERNIARISRVDRTIQVAPPWQHAAYDLLDAALVDAMQARMFDGLGQLIENQPLSAGLAHRISLQVNFLLGPGNRAGPFELKEGWDPTPRPAGS